MADPVPPFETRLDPPKDNRPDATSHSSVTRRVGGYIGELLAEPLALMRDRKAFLAEVGQGQQLPEKILGLSVCSAVLLGVFGLVLGALHSPFQAIVSAFKLPVLFFLTLAVCFPTLYIFNSFIGSRQGFLRYCTLVFASTNIISLLMLGFFPVSLFFLLTLDDPGFFTLLNVAIVGLTSTIGTLFLCGSILELETYKCSRFKRPLFLLFWFALYAAIGCQLAWHLSPFFGTPGEPFVFFGDAKESNFLWAILDLLAGR